jgi:hypothetical protein
MRPILLAFAATLTLAACSRGGDGNNMAALDNQLVGNQADDAVDGALGNQISVDPAAANGSKASANGQATGHAGAAEKARLALNGADHKGCAAESAPLENGNQWADRLPAAFGNYPGATVTEAAANNANGCSVRIVSLTTSDDWQRVLDWYNTRAVKGGYTSEHRVDGTDHILGGTNDKSGAAYYLIVTPGNGTTEIEFIADKGR